ncbi:chromosome partitioning protein ParA [Mobilicoccus pelagius NBRC 104925]|uniref:Chromosome partitioning protein ParA n=1 Tax=Mobilicoccus pelagius NBRC 104925 TaxID=1089455 RepID=H5USY5_9MICO|nr:chromosome partitioning protein ParA [Mobilicoccus pelagius NBRC 104925]
MDAVGGPDGGVGDPDDASALVSGSPLSVTASTEDTARATAVMPESGRVTDDRQDRPGPEEDVPTPIAPTSREQDSDDGTGERTSVGSTGAADDTGVSRETETPRSDPAGGSAVAAETARKAEVKDTGAPRLPTPPGAPFPRPEQTRVFTIANQKGGVGKTTTAVNLAAALAAGGSRVLVIDTDPQGNASTALGVDHRAGVASVYDVLVEDAPVAEVVHQCPDIPGLTCVPATIDLAGAEIELVSFVAREMRLRRAVDAYLADVDDPPDYILIDCPPSLGLLTINAFVAGHEVLIPIQCEYYALEGLSMLLRNIDMIRRHLNPELRLSTILLTMYDGRTRLSSQVADEVRNHFPNEVLRATVPRSVRVSEAPSHGQTVISYDPASTGALAYCRAAAELATRHSEATHGRNAE